jgi:predicted permease
VKPLAAVLALLRRLARRDRFESGMSEEIAHHLELRAADLEREGLAPAEALRRARLEFGADERWKEECREAAGYAPLDALRGDFRDAARALRRSPGFTLVATLVLGLVLTADLLAFAFADAYLLRPLPIAEADRHVELVATDDAGREQWQFDGAEADALIASAGRVIEHAYRFRLHRPAVLEPSPRRTYAEVVSGAWFDLRRPRLAAGRAFGAWGGLDEGEPVAVLSDAGWKRLLAAHPQPIGRTLLVDGVAFTVVGVLAPGEGGLEPVVPELWLPLAAAERLLPMSPPSRAGIGGVLRPGVSPEQAAAALAPVLATAATADSPTRALRVHPRTTLLRESRELAPLTLSLLFAFALLTAVAAANLTGLHLARATARRRDVAVRAALGASRGRLLRPLVLEGLLLGAGALVMAWGLARLAIAAVEGAVFSLALQAGLVLTPVGISARALLACGLLAVAVGALGSLLPALQATRVDLRSGLGRDGALFGGRLGAGRLRGALVVGQVAASLGLLVGAGLIARNAARADDVDPGFALAGLVDLNADRADSALVARLSEMPGVRSVAATAFTPLAGGQPRLDATVDGVRQRLGYNVVDERYFETLGLRVVHGRGLAPGDDGVAVVSEATARLLWPGADPLGRSLSLDRGDPGPRPFVVVGVVSDAATGFFFEGRDRSLVYLPPGPEPPDELLLRVAGDARAGLPALREACADQGVLCEPVPLADLLARQRMPFTVLSGVALALGGLALGLACLGLHGLVAFAVARATRELGVRMALGATRGTVLRGVLAGAARRAATGVAFGLLPCLALSALLAAQVPQLQAFDAAVYALVPLLLLAVATAAALPPAWRAARVDPVVALREE